MQQQQEKQDSSKQQKEKRAKRPKSFHQGDLRIHLFLQKRPRALSDKSPESPRGQQEQSPRSAALFFGDIKEGNVQRGDKKQQADVQSQISPQSLK